MTAVQPQPDIKGYVHYLATEAAQKALSPNVRRLGVETLNLIAAVERLTAERDRARAAQIALEQELAVKDEALAELRELQTRWEREGRNTDANAEEPIAVGLLRSAIQLEFILDALAARIDAHLFPTDEVCSSCGAPLDSLGCQRGPDGRRGHTTGGGCEANPTDEEGASGE